jgi:hypothetical protein
MILFTLIPDHVSGVGVLFCPFQQYTTKKHLTLHHSSIGLYNITVFFNNKLPISS